MEPELSPPMFDPADPNIIGGVRFWTRMHFDIPSTRSREHYESTIRRVRTDLGKPVGDDMLMVSVDKEPHLKFFAIVFIDDNGETLPVAYRRSDLFLNGFLTTETVDGKTTFKWMELKETQDQTECTIPGAKLLNLTMDYGCLNGKPHLGYDALDASVKSLLRVTTNTLDSLMRKSVADDLLNLITMTSEALRFNAITTLVGCLFRRFSSSKGAPDWLAKLVKNWSRLSKLALENMDEEDGKEVAWLCKYGIYVYDLEKEAVQIKTVRQLKSALGMLTNAAVDDDNLARGKKEKLSGRKNK